MDNLQKEGEGESQPMLFFVNIPGVIKTETMASSNAQAASYALSQAFTNRNEFRFNGRVYSGEIGLKTLVNDVLSDPGFFDFVQQAPGMPSKPLTVPLPLAQPQAPGRPPQTPPQTPNQPQVPQVPPQASITPPPPPPQQGVANAKHTLPDLDKVAEVALKYGVPDDIADLLATRTAKRLQLDGEEEDALLEILKAASSNISPNTPPAPIRTPYSVPKESAPNTDYKPADPENRRKAPEGKQAPISQEQEVAKVAARYLWKRASTLAQEHFHKPALASFAGRWTNPPDPLKREGTFSNENKLASNDKAPNNLKRECDHAEEEGGYCGRCEGRPPKKTAGTHDQRELPLIPNTQLFQSGGREILEEKAANGDLSFGDLELLTSEEVSHLIKLSPANLQPMMQKMLECYPGQMDLLGSEDFGYCDVCDASATIPEEEAPDGSGMIGPRCKDHPYGDAPNDETFVAEGLKESMGEEVPMCRCGHPEHNHTRSGPEGDNLCHISLGGNSYGVGSEWCDCRGFDPLSETLSQKEMDESEELSSEADGAGSINYHQIAQDFVAYANDRGLDNFTDDREHAASLAGHIEEFLFDTVDQNPEEYPGVYIAESTQPGQWGDNNITEVAEQVATLINVPPRGELSVFNPELSSESVAKCSWCSRSAKLEDGFCSDECYRQSQGIPGGESSSERPENPSYDEKDSEALMDKVAPENCSRCGKPIEDGGDPWDSHQTGESLCHECDGATPENHEGLGGTASKKEATSEWPTRLPDGWVVEPLSDIDPGGSELRLAPGTKFLVLDNRTDIVGEGATEEEAIQDALSSLMPGSARELEDKHTRIQDGLGGTASLFSSKDAENEQPNLRKED